MTTGDGVFLRTYLQEAQRDTDELVSITEKTPRFLEQIANAPIDKIFPRQGLLNDRHTERLLNQIRMTHLGQPLGSPNTATTTTQALPMVEVQKTVETVVVPMTPEKQKKRISVADSDDDVDDKPKKPTEEKKSAQTSDGSTSSDEDDEQEDADNGFDEELEKQSTKKSEHSAEKTSTRTQKDDDSSSESKADSVDLEIESADGDEESEEDSEEDDDDGDDAEDVIEEDDSQNSEEVRGNEVMKRLRRTEGEVLAKKLEKTKLEIERGVKELGQQQDSDDDDEEFDDNEDDEEEERNESTGDNSAASDDEDDDASQRPRKKAKKTPSKDATPKKSALAPKEKASGKSAKSVRIAVENGDDGDDEPVEQPKKKKKLVVRLSELTAQEKAIVEEQAKRSATRRAKKGNWITSDALKDVVTVACNDMFMRDYNAKHNLPPKSLFATIRKDTSDDEVVRRLKKSLYAVFSAISETMSVIERPGAEVIQTLTDFVERTIEIRSCPLEADADEVVQCAFCRSFFKASEMVQLTAFKSKKPGEITQNTAVVVRDFNDLVDAVAFLRNFELRTEEMVKARLVKISTYIDRTTTATDAAKMLRDDPVNKPAHVLLSTRLRLALETVDRSMRIIKSAQDKEIKKKE